MHTTHKTIIHAIRLLSLTGTLLPAVALAGGFSLNEQSASAMGTANAGAAANPENASIVLFNPAGMSQLSGTNLSFGAAVVDIDARAKDDSIAVTRQNPSVPVRPASDGGDIADPAVLPHLYLAHEVNDNIDVGFALHAPYGLAADYDNDFAGRFFADKTELTAVAFSPSVAVSTGEGLSMGAGINVIYAEGRLTRFQDLSATPAGAGALLMPEPYADIQGDDIGVTFRVGFLYELSDRTQFGLTAQTGTELELEGDAEIRNVTITPGVTTTLNEKVTVPLSIPETLTFGARHRLTDDITLLAGATYARWSRFQELDVISREADGDIPNVNAGDAFVHITERWKNTWQFNLGGIWQATPAWALKAGYAWDESPVDEYVTARIPSEDRHWLTLGAQWQDVRSGWAVDAAVGTLIFEGDAEVDDREYSHAAPTAPISPARYQGTYELSALSASLQVSKAF